jgi:hypothetical protein
METTRPCRFFELSGLVRTNSMNVAFYRIYPLESHVHGNGANTTRLFLITSTGR